MHNFFLGLTAFTLIIVGIDLQSEIARDKNEIISVVAVLSQILNPELIYAPYGAHLNFPLIGIIPYIAEHIIFSDALICLKDRSPPLNS